MKGSGFMFWLLQLGLGWLIYSQWQEVESETELERVPLEMHGIHLKPSDAFEMTASKGFLSMGEDLSFTLEGCDPIEIEGMHQLRPNLVRFMPSTGAMEVRGIRVGESLKIHRVWTQPDIRNFNIKGLKTFYKVGEGNLTWESFEMEELSCRDWVSYLKFFSEQKTGFLSSSNSKGDVGPGEKGITSHSKPSYIFKAEKVSLHITILHVRAMVEKLEFATAKGPVFSKRARVNFKNQSLVCYDGFTNFGLSQEPFEQLVFSLQTGEVKVLP